MNNESDTNQRTPEYWNTLNYEGVFCKALIDTTEALKFAPDGGIETLETLKSVLLPSVKRVINLDLDTTQKKWGDLIKLVPFSTFNLKKVHDTPGSPENTIFRRIPEPDRTRIFQQCQHCCSYNDVVSAINVIRILNRTCVMKQLEIIMEESDRQRLLMSRARPIDTGRMGGIS